jgi:hypothetical protein
MVSVTAAPHQALTHLTPVAEAFRPPGDPSDWDLREARWIDLTRIAGSDSAKAMAATVAELVAGHQDRRRPLGPDGRATLRHHVGIILGGLLRGAFRGRLVSIHSSPKGGVWQDQVVGQRAGWGILNAMARVDLVGVRTGVQTSAFGDEIFRGLPTRVWAKPGLLELAAALGVTAETLNADWTVNPAVERKPIVVKPDDLVVVRSLERGGARLPVPAAQADEADWMRGHLAALNEHVRTVLITGCLPPAFRRVFRADLRLGGRFYAVGGSNYQNLPKEDRRLIRIGGEPVVEVDLHAAFLTILLGRSGVEKLPADDLYDAVGLPRAATKAWMVQTFATGRPLAGWSVATPAEVKALGVSAAAVRSAALRAYPALADLPVILPAELRRSLPADRHGWAVGQYLTNLESRVMTVVLESCSRRGVVGLPMHDAIIVPASCAGTAADSLRKACRVVARIEPIVKVSDAGELP